MFIQTQMIPQYLKFSTFFRSYWFNVEYVLQVVLKIIKHCQEEGAGGTDLVQGVLLGLVVDTRLEITNCFPFPRHNEEEDFDEGIFHS